MLLSVARKINKKASKSKIKNEAISIFPAISFKYGITVHSELIHKLFVKVGGAAAEHAADIVEIDSGILVDLVFIHELFKTLEQFQ